jgi:hypothetical protein
MVYSQVDVRLEEGRSDEKRGVSEQRTVCRVAIDSRAGGGSS